MVEPHKVIPLIQSSLPFQRLPKHENKSYKVDYYLNKM